MSNENNDEKLLEEFMFISSSRSDNEDIEVSLDDYNEQSSELSDEDVESFNHIIASRNSNNDLNLNYKDSNKAIDLPSDSELKLSELRNLSVRDRNISDDTEEELDRIISDNYYDSKQSRIYTPPSGAILLTEVPEDPDKYVSYTQNGVLTKAVMIVASVLLIAAIIITSAFFYYKNKSVVAEGNTTPSIEEVIDRGALPNNSNEQQAGQVQNSVKGMSQRELSTINSTIEYRIESSGSINLASAAYIQDNGTEKVENFSSFPWTRTVNLVSNIVPQLGASASGNGELTCTILQDGKEMVTKTADGTDPTVIC